MSPIQEDDVSETREPRVVDATPEQNKRARAACRDALNVAVLTAASALHDQPLSIKALIGRLLIEDFAALDVSATGDWLRVNNAENVALANGSDARVQHARALRCDAFTRLAKAEIARAALAQASPADEETKS